MVSLIEHLVWLGRRYTDGRIRALWSGSPSTSPVVQVIRKIGIRGRATRCGLGGLGSRVLNWELAMGGVWPGTERKEGEVLGKGTTEADPQT